MLGCGYQIGDWDQILIMDFFQITLNLKLNLFFLPPNYGWRRLSQRVAMDDLASYFVEERSKVR